MKSAGVLPIPEVLEMCPRIVSEPRQRRSRENIWRELQADEYSVVNSLVGQTNVDLHLFEKELTEFVIQTFDEIDALEAVDAVDIMYGKSGTVTAEFEVRHVDIFARVAMHGLGVLSAEKKHEQVMKLLLLQRVTCGPSGQSKATQLLPNQR
ncbi:MAG: hypothetical protein M3P98_02525 [bacterium]|nr:hypothetical protein [bacterium]